jgi:hypothetical protein
MPKAKKTVKRVSLKLTPEISKPYCEVQLTERFLLGVREKTKAERLLMGEAINAARDAWGQPHLHRGCGIRRLHKDFYECRCGLDTRLVFEVVAGALRFHLEGNHDAIRRFIKYLR